MLVVLLILLSRLLDGQDKFEKHLKEEEAIRTEEQKATLSYLETELEISPIDNPYDYVKELQSRFDNSGIEYSDEYYDVLGLIENNNK